jgi:hypothetical protein
MSNKRILQSFPSPHLLTKDISLFFSGQAGEDLSRLRAAFPPHWDIFILGGLVRNFLLEALRGLKLASSDVDIVIKGPESRGELQRVIQGFSIRQNDFGGYKCLIRPDGLVFDIWRIQDHASISSPPYNAEQLLRHNLLDVDALAWEVKTEYLHDYGCIAAIERASINLLTEGIAPNFLPAQVAHILITTMKTRFEVSDEVRRFVRHVCDSPQNTRDVVAILRRKAPASSAELEEFLDDFLKGEARSWTALTR